MSKYSDWKNFKGILLNKSPPKGHQSCLCNSGKNFRNCHQAAFFGLWELNKLIKANTSIIK